MKWFLMVMMFSCVGMAENSLSVNFGFNGDFKQKTFKEKDDAPGFMSLKAKFKCPVVFSQANKDKKASYLIGCKANGVTARSHIICDGIKRSFLFDIEGEKDVFLIEATCSDNKEKI